MVTWKYRKSSSIKHLFKSEFDSRAPCGAGWSFYTVITWFMDEEGLKERRECRNCTYISKGEGVFKR